ncbi:DeoR family transcriptional regulator (plasmid) [Fulvitalea axinellae]|uniref:DeoR family transcriptional regulator n=1 Tax=Fulvitalea axinellae TaxID=1182444 RepID=A0AAU9D2F9_9BACT|nr:DeoR family transcriptional regulator [Fulvitalea axinellae]
MLKRERQDYILGQVRLNNKVLSSELSLELSVSEDTIRRDLRELSDNGKIRKVHGGAMSSTSYIPFSYEDRKVFGQEKKILIAKKALGLLRDDMVVMIDGGTTNLEIVKMLPQDFRGTFVTNCVPVASELAKYRKVETIMVGGRLVPNAQTATGADAIECVHNVRADLFFLGTRSIHPEQGVTDIDRDEVLVKKAMIGAAERTVSLATEDKLNIVQPFVAGKINQIDMLVTNLPAEAEHMHPFAEKGVKIL